jgi:D-beta-D-heptose 7-phosphate kinase/D-beta-D-heptose 1-phosphate adenosyltransferase
MTPAIFQFRGGLGILFLVRHSPFATMHSLDQQLARLAETTVLCIGDLMLDDFVYGEVSRISPEAPAPVLAVTRSELVIGGGGNVARNLASLGARCVFVGVVGEDDASGKLMRALAAEPMIEPHLVVDKTRPTTRKVRFVSEHFSTHLLRADWELARTIGAPIEKAVIDRALAALPDVASVVLSDYAKGVLTPRVIRTVIEAARAAGKPVIVDPKGKDFSIYRDTTVIKPNRQELAEATRRPAVTDADIVAAATELNEIVRSEAVLVTRSEQGMTLVPAVGAPIHVPGYPVKVRDVSGCGDTAVAVLAAMLGVQAEFEGAMRAANAAAAVVVGKRGTATVSLAELRARMLPAASLAFEEKIVFDWTVLDERLEEWRRRGLQIGFTNGCFDIFHRGHVKLLTQARAACDRLVVGLNDDASVRRLKGEGRPLQDVHARAEVLAALEAVDLVVAFADDTPLKLIERVRPQVLIKGSDYRREEVVGHELVEAFGGKTVLVDLLPGHSTTALVARSAQSAAPADAASNESAKPARARRKSKA